jgi:hypothetical protein
MPDSNLPAIPDRPPPACRLRDWKPWTLPNPSLIGHATVTFNSGWTINSIPIFRRGDGTLSAGPPSVPILDADGRHKRDAVGKKSYAAVITFEGTGRDLWNKTVLRALADAGINPTTGEGAA